MTRVLGHRGALAALLVAVAFPATAAAGLWSSVGGDSGRSGFEPLAHGHAPWTGLWQATDLGDQNVRTSVIVTAPGNQGESPRVVYGTADGTIHLRDLFTGEPIGAPDGVNISQHKNKDVFTGFGGSVAPLDSSGSNGLGQIYVVENDRYGPTEDNPDMVTDEIAIAQIDELSGHIVDHVLVPGSEKQVISSPPLLTEDDGAGNRSIIFQTVDKEDYEADYGTDSPQSAPTLWLVPLHNASSPNSKIDVGNTQSDPFDFGQLTPLASPALIAINNDTTDPPGRPLDYVTVSTADPGKPLKTVESNRFFDTLTGGFLAVYSGPSSPKLDPAADAAAHDLYYAMTASIPVTPSGRPPGTYGSQAGHAPAIIVATYSPKDNLTYVHRLVLTADGSAIEIAATSAPFTGRPAAQLATTQTGAAPGDSVGEVILTTGRNVYGLDGGDLTVDWKLDELDALSPGDTGFQHTSATVTNGTVFVTRDNGHQLALDLKTGKPLPADAFSEDPGNSASISAVAAPAATPNGIVVFASDKGVFAYRDACGNYMKGTDRADGLSATLAGDDADLRGGDDSIDLGPGDDCADGGSGNDTIAGGQGSDTLVGGTGIDRLVGGIDDDTLLGGFETDKISGGDGDDRIDGGEGNDTLKGGNGADSITGGVGRDRIYGSLGADSLNGGAGNDRLSGGSGNDTLRGGAGRDRLYGGAGSDVLTSGKGGGYISAGRGNDRIDSSNGERDSVHCGSGRDTVRPDRDDVLYGCEVVLRAGAPVGSKRPR